MSSTTPSRQAKASSLQQTASTVFVLTAVLPLLIFLWILHALDAMHDPRVQVGLTASLVISLLGFMILRTIMRRTSEVLQLLIRAETPPRDATTPSATMPPGDSTPESAAASSTATPSASSPRAATSAHVASAAARPLDTAPAVGSIKELRDAAQMVARRWRREAEPLTGLAVLVSVANMERPETGTLVRLTDDGMVLEQDGMEFGVLWRFVTSIEPDPSPSPAPSAT